MKNRDFKSSRKVVEVNDLSFLSDRNHSYGWIKRHFRHHLLRRALKKSRIIIASNPNVAKDLTRYYFIPRNRIIIK